MNFNKLNTVLLGIICLLVLSTLLIDISVNISWSASITDWLSVIIYFCTLFAAVTAAVIAKKALDENRKTTKTQTEPFIDIKLEVMPQSISWIRLKITNIGLTSAFDISFNFNELDRNNEKVTRNIIGEFSEISFMRNG